MNIDNIKLFILSLVLKFFTFILTSSKLLFNNNTIVTVRSYSSIHLFIISVIDRFIHVAPPFNKHIMLIRGFLNNVINYCVINALMFICLPHFLEPSKMLDEKSYNEFVNKNFTYNKGKKRTAPFSLRTSEGLTWLFTNSFAFIFLNRIDNTNVYVADFTYLEKYELKEGFPSLACKVIFDLKNKKLTLRYVEYDDNKFEPSDPNFDSISMIVGSACLSVGGMYHGIYSHIIIADTMELSNNLCLSANHPLRRLLAFPEYNIYYIGSSVFFVGYSKIVGTIKLLHSFTDKGWNDLTADTYNCFNIELWGNIPKMLVFKNYDLDDLSWAPIIEDSFSWWNTIHTFVESYVNIYYTSDVDVSSDLELINWIKTITSRVSNSKISNIDDLIDFITIIIYNGSIHHQIFGENIRFLLFDSYQLTISVKLNPITKKYEPYDIINPLRTLILYHMVSLTTNRIYKDWSYLVLNEITPKNNLARKTFRQFYEDMTELKNEFVYKNKTREVPFEDLYPEIVACSAGI